VTLYDANENSSVVNSEATVTAAMSENRTCINTVAVQWLRWAGHQGAEPPGPSVSFLQ